MLIHETALQLLLSPHILNEYKRVIVSDEILGKRTKHDLNPFPVVEHLLQNALLVEPKTVWNICEDPDDDHVLACAREGNAQYLVTQDQHLLTLHTYGSTKILTPEAFLAKKHF